VLEQLHRTLSGELMTEETHTSGMQNQQKYRWPWVVAALVLLGIALAILWMSKEIARARRIHDLNAPSTKRLPTSSLCYPPPNFWRA
jgi:hypothetical protein